MLKNKSNFIEYNIIIPFFIKKWYRKWEKNNKIVHLIIDLEKFFTNVHFGFDSTVVFCIEKLFINLEKKHINKYNIKHKEQN